MAKKFDAMQAAAGQISGLMLKLLKIRDELGVSPEEFHTLFTDEGDSHLKWMLEGLKKPMVAGITPALLAFVATVTIPAVTRLMNPQVAFKQPHIDLWGDFEQSVLPTLKPITSAPGAVFTVSRLTRASNDSEIRKKLPEHHLSEWHHVTSLIDQQKFGESGALFTNAIAYICYMLGVYGEVLTVGIFWSSDDNKWRVRDWNLNEVGGWDTGTQIVYPGNAAL